MGLHHHLVFATELELLLRNIRNHKYWQEFFQLTLFVSAVFKTIQILLTMSKGNDIHELNMKASVVVVAGACWCVSVHLL